MTASPEEVLEPDLVARPRPIPVPDAEDGRADGEQRVEPYAGLVSLLAQLVDLDADDPRRRVVRDRLGTGFLPVVRNIANRYRNRGEPVADLVQAGSIGLLNALDRFDPEPGVELLGAFLGYAIPTVTGEIRRHFRDQTWSMRVPRRLKELQGPLREAVVTLSHSLGRAPRPSEIAARLGRPVDEVIEALGAQDSYHPASLDALSTAGSTLGGSLGRADAALDRVEYRQALRQALDELPERERTILVLRFFGDLTQTQIAKQVGVSQMHVSRLLSQTLADLRHQLGR